MFSENIPSPVSSAMLNRLSMVIGSLPHPEPQILEEADIDSLSEMLVEMSNDAVVPPYAWLIDQPEYLLMGLGLIISLLSAVNFARIVEDKLNSWKEDRLPLRPLANIGTTFSYAGVVIGVTFVIAGSMQVFNFAYVSSLIFGFLVSILTGVIFWLLIKRVMREIEEGNFRAVDFDNFDEFL